MPVPLEEEAGEVEAKAASHLIMGWGNSGGGGGGFAI